MKRFLSAAALAAIVFVSFGCEEKRTGPQQVSPEARQQQKEEEQKVREGEEANQKKQRAVNGQ